MHYVLKQRSELDHTTGDCPVISISHQLKDVTGSVPAAAV